MTGSTGGFIFNKEDIESRRQFTEEEALFYLSNSEYYKNLNSLSLVNLLNSISKENLLLLIKNEDLLSYIKPTHTPGLVKLEFEDIINTPYLIKRFDKDLLMYMIKEEYDKFGIYILGNENICEFLYGEQIKLGESELNELDYLIQYTAGINNNDEQIELKDIKHFISMYLLLGIKDSAELINMSQVNVNVEDVLKLKERLLQAKVNSYRINNSYRLNNLYDSIIYALDKIEDPINLHDSDDSVLDWFMEEVEKIDYTEKIDPYIMEDLFKKYISIKDNPLKRQAAVKIQKEIRSFAREVRTTIIKDVADSYDKKLRERLKNIFKIKDSVLDTLYNKYYKKIKIEALVEETFSVVNSEDSNKRNLLYEALRNKMDLTGIPSFEYFSKHMFIPILYKKFNKMNFISKVGYKEPHNYKDYLFVKKMEEELNRVNKLFQKIPNNKEIFDYLLQKEANMPSGDVSKVLLKELRYALDKYKKYLVFDGEKLIYEIKTSYDVSKCAEYEAMIKRTNSNSRYIFTVLKEQLEPDVNYDITEEDIEKYLNNVPLNSKKQEVNKSPLTPEELKFIFGNFDFSSLNEEFNEGAKRFLLKNIYNIRLAIGTEDQSYVENFGYILSHFDNLVSICDFFSIDINDITVEQIKSLQDYMVLELTPFEDLIPKDIVAKIVNDVNFVSIKEASNRVRANSLILEEAEKKNVGTIPIIKKATYEILDYHDPRMIVSSMNDLSCFKVSAPGNDFLSYCMTSKNGSVIFIKDYRTEEVIGRISAVRRGNAYFLHQLQIKDELIKNKAIYSYCEKVIKKLAEDVIKQTSNTSEPIEIVTITTFNDEFKYNQVVKTTDCEYVHDPIDVETEDFIKFANSNFRYEMFRKTFYHNYGAVDCKTVIVSTAPGKNRTDFKDYDAKPIYRKKRELPKIVESQNMDDHSVKELRKIMYLNERKTKSADESSLFSKNLSLEGISKIYISTDWCVMVYNNNELKVIDLGYDERSKAEIDEVIEGLNFERRSL